MTIALKLPALHRLTHASMSEPAVEDPTTRRKHRLKRLAIIFAIAIGSGQYVQSSYRADLANAAVPARVQAQPHSSVGLGASAVSTIDRV